VVATLRQRRAEPTGARGQQSNLELAAALSRMRQAAAQARIAGVALLPSVDASAGASRDLPVAGNRNANVSTSAQLQVSYELDFWGKNAASAAAARRRSGPTSTTVKPWPSP
jgi:outer membrane protein TolC